MNTLDFLSSVPLYRKQLLPVWVKFFCWFFLIAGPLIILLFVAAPLLPVQKLSQLGITVDNSINLISISFVFLLLFKIVTAVSLLKEKNYAVTLAKTDAFLSLVLCIGAMLYHYFAKRSIYL